MAEKEWALLEAIGSAHIYILEAMGNDSLGRVWAVFGRRTHDAVLWKGRALR